MGTKTTYTCDKCGRTEDHQSFLFKLSTSVDKYQYSYRIETTHKQAFHAKPVQTDWCGECCAKLGLAELIDAPKAEEPSPPMSMEDFIREIIREEIGCQQQ